MHPGTRIASQAFQCSLPGCFAVGTVAALCETGLPLQRMSDTQFTA